MGDFAQAQDYNLVTIHTASLESLGVEQSALFTALTSTGVWPAANRAIYVPFMVFTPITAVKMFTVNDGVASGNIDVGIYDKGQNRLVSMGPTGMSGTNAIQTFDIADTLLEPGAYYMAMSCSSGTASFNRAAPALGLCSALGILSQSSAGTLPSPGVFAAAQDAYLPAFGLTARTVV
jgi:hypothetical protein